MAHHDELNKNRCRRRMPTLFAAVRPVAERLKPNSSLCLVYSRRSWVARQIYVTSGVPFQVSAPPVPHFLIFWRFEVWWPWPLTFSNENCHSTHSHFWERLYQFFILILFFCVFSRYEPVRDRETDRRPDRRTGKTRNVAYRTAA